MRIEVSQGIPSKLRQRDERKDLAISISDMVDATENARSERNARDEENERLYRLQPVERSYQPFPGSANFGFPLMKSKVDALVGTVFTTIITQDKYFKYKSRVLSPGQIDQIESAIQFHLDHADFDRKLKTHLLLTTLNGRAIYKTTFRMQVKGFTAGHPTARTPHSTGEFSFVGPQVDVVHPKDFAFYPTGISELSQAKLVGDRVFMREAEVRAYMKAGIFIDDEDVVLTRTDPQESHAGQDPNWTGVLTDDSLEPEDELIELWNCLVRLDMNGDGIEEIYEVTIAKETQELLAIKQYDYDTFWYFAPQFTPEYGTFIPSGSVAQDMQGLTKAHNEILNMHYDGTLSVAHPAILATRGSGMMQDAWENIKPGEIFFVDDVPQITRIDSGYNAAGMPLMLQMIDILSEGVTRVPRTALQQPAGSRTTATEINAMQQAAAISGNDYLLSYCSTELTDMIDFIRQMAYDNYELLIEHWGENYPIDDKEILRGGGTWAVAGKSPSKNPMAQLQGAQMLLQLAMNPATAQYVDVQEILKAIVAASGLDNADKIYKEGGDGAQIDPSGLAGIVQSPELQGLAGLEGILQPQAGVVPENFSNQESAQF